MFLIPHTKNVPDNTLLLGTLFLLAFSVIIFSLLSISLVLSCLHVLKYIFYFKEALRCQMTGVVHLIK